MWESADSAIAFLLLVERLCIATVEMRPCWVSKEEGAVMMEEGMKER
jgi:hypothetical protein